MDIVKLRNLFTLHQNHNTKPFHFEMSFILCLSQSTASSQQTEHKMQLMKANKFLAV